jgi:hypothetical protein
MHARITAITELAVESGLTNRLPPDNAKQSFFLALSPLPKRRQFGFPRARKRESLHHVIGCSASRSRLRCWAHSARHTTADRMAAHRKSNRRRDDFCADELGTNMVHLEQACGKVSELFGYRNSHERCEPNEQFAAFYWRR